MLIEKTLDQYKNRVFVESGSYYGGGIERAMQSGFCEIHSIEIHKQLYDICLDKFSDNSKVHLYLGDSCNVLWGIIKEINEPITFWLDGHVQDSLTIGKVGVPILEELEIISKHPLKNHTILIDDINLAGTKLNPRVVGGRDIELWENIPKELIIERLMNINNNYKITYEDNKWGVGRILVAYDGSIL